MEFYKLSATGNDFILFYNININSNDVIKLCNRNYFIGADGIITIDELLNVSIYNADGSKAKMCGNGLRCVGKLLNTLFNKDEFIINIDNTSYTISKIDEDNYKVNMPIPIMILYKNCYLVNVSNNHFVIICNNLDEVNFNEYLDIVKDKKANIHAIKVINRNKIHIKTFEYGVNETLSCGSGSVASFFVLYMLDKVNDSVDVISKGGTINVSVNNNSYYLKGKVSLVYKGELYGF